MCTCVCVCVCVSSQVRCSSRSTLGELLTSLANSTSRMNSYLQSSSWVCTLWEGMGQCFPSTPVHQHVSVAHRQYLTDSLFGWLISSVSAGCRGGLLLCAISAVTCRIRVKLFGALTKQEIGFFETTKTGKAL